MVCIAKSDIRRSSFDVLFMKPPSSLFLFSICGYCSFKLFARNLMCPRVSIRKKDD